MHHHFDLYIEIHIDNDMYSFTHHRNKICDSYTEDDVAVVGSGTCGVNGNTKLFAADQSATTCDGGNIGGLYFNKAMIQSQLTTITEDATGQIYRTGLLRDSILSL
jgi:ribulose 1,5-bisphosphate synthetase/thiazole synthase